jgi:phenylpropionate dioxygenase-like ring-hydroxylating dioxygenase large terminal subunit
MSVQDAAARGRAGNGREPLPAWAYGNEELNELEYERLFRPSWQFACHVSQVAKARDYFVFDLWRDSVLVVRGDDGELRAFLNVCRHRGTKIADGAGTCRGRLTCPYHGWTYDLTGALVGRPAEKTFEHRDLGGLGLRRVELEVLCGLVFVRIVPGGPSLREMWADYAHLLQPYRLEEMVPMGEIWIETWNCNWKVGVDNNLENYHVPIGHPGYNRMLDSDMMGFLNGHGVAGSRSVLRDAPSKSWSERMYQEMAPRVNADLPEQARGAWLFLTMPPNMGLDVYGDSMDVFQFFPRTARTCTVRYPIFGRPGESRELKVLRYLNLRINRKVSAEDRFLSERVQLGLDSHGFRFGPFSDYEHCIYDFHERVRAACPVESLLHAPLLESVREVNARMLEAGALSGPARGS